MSGWGLHPRRGRDRAAQQDGVGPATVIIGTAPELSKTETIIEDAGCQVVLRDLEDHRLSAGARYAKQAFGQQCPPDSAAAPAGQDPDGQQFDVLGRIVARAEAQRESGGPAGVIDGD